MIVMPMIAMQMRASQRAGAGPTLSKAGAHRDARGRSRDRARCYEERHLCHVSDRQQPSAVNGGM